MPEPQVSSETLLTPDPSCVQRIWTGWAGVLTVGVGAILLVLFRCLNHPKIPNTVEYVGLLVAAGLLMILLELAVFRAYRHQFDFRARRHLGRPDHVDVARQFAAVLITLILAWAAYAVFGEYALNLNGFLYPQFEKSWYRPFFRLFEVATMVLPILAIPYLYLCAAFRRWPREEDEMLRLWNGYAALVRFRRPAPEFLAAWRSLLVKFFFIPVMTVFFVNNAASFESRLIAFLAGPGQSGAVVAERLFRALFEGLFLMDVSLALLGYICCFRLLDTHIRRAESTLLGWAVALACYPPFNLRITGLYLPTEPDGQSWSQLLAGIPWLYGLVGVVIVVLLAIYVYATMAFGLRFSNLTHRGILCRGPYAWVRHPAYVSKNLAWWLLALPFLSGVGDCVRLLLLNTIYVLRALTEERLLGSDPAYFAYRQRVKWRFIPGLF